jgi:hypothetical protein
MPLNAPPPQVASKDTRPAHEIEAERRLELLRKVKIIREGFMRRGELLKGDPAKEYCWVNVREERQIFYRQLGWAPVKVNPNAPHVVSSWPPNAEGNIVRGDVILYEIDKELAEAHQIYSVARGLELTERPGQDFEAAMERLAVPLFRPKA